MRPSGTIPCGISTAKISRKMVQMTITVPRATARQKPQDRRDSKRTRMNRNSAEVGRNPKGRNNSA